LAARLQKEIYQSATRRLTSWLFCYTSGRTGDLSVWVARKQNRSQWWGYCGSVRSKPPKFNLI